MQEEAFHIGNADVLAKPFFVSAFKEKILEIQRKRKNQETLPEGEEEFCLKGLHLLVAEDNEINAEILSELLSMEGVTCEIMENGKLAAERFALAQCLL